MSVLHENQAHSSPSKIEGGGGSTITSSKMSSKKKYPKNSLELKRIRRELRNNSTVAEKALWNWLKGRQVEGLRFRRQFSIEHFVLDFYCPELKLCIELDGDYHFHVNQPVSDAERSLFLLEKYGIKTLRFENKLVFIQPRAIIDAIINFKESKLHTPQSLCDSSPSLGEQLLHSPANQS